MQYPFKFFISDTQEPFCHRDGLEFSKYIYDKFGRPYKKEERKVFHVGDEVDQHTLGKWPSDPNGRSGGDEFEEAKHRLRDWYRAFPYVDVCTSNHTYRAWKNAFLAGIPKQFMKEIGEAYEAPPGWRWADRWFCDDICVEHGEFVSGPMACLRAAMANRMSTVIGHQHTHAGVIYSASIQNQIWGMNVGCLIDIDQYAFRYGRALRNKPNLGVGTVIDGNPFFHPMIVDKHNRWIGR